MHAEAFDDLAADYDATFTDTAIGKALRTLVWSRMDTALRDSRRVLDLGCGTGEDAVRLARNGTKVVAIDSSANMVRAARSKAENAGCQQLIEFRCASMEDLRRVLDDRGFDGVLSNFGAINCVRDLPGLVRDVATCLEPGAVLIWVMLGRRVPWEWAWYLARGQPDKAWRRLQQDDVSWRGLTIRYPPPSELAALLEQDFIIQRISPLGVALPPTYAAPWVERSAVLLRALMKLETLGQRCTALASWSDHYIVEAVRKGAAP
ncbi:class I SAM-dependent methyltransferase [Steroidobacter cummioxidans]|uniref:class I SAM-dependent methyltransferase n=1 Tax=Steroidobacter cummioxidans TaxID=1803913 RepID=UPI00137B234F|nr:class I SAM-dependent methyltransferase [Steroidobacter cummioxidans]